MTVIFTESSVVMKNLQGTHCSVDIAAYYFDTETVDLEVLLHGDEDKTIHRNVGKWLLNDKTEYPRRLENLATPI